MKKKNTTTTSNILNTSNNIHITIKWLDETYNVCIHNEDEKFFDFIVDNIDDLIHQLQDFTEGWLRAKQKFYIMQTHFLKKEED